MRRLLLAAALLLPAAAWGQALDLSKGGPIDVTAQDGMEWRQNEQVVIARGNARAVRGDVTVTADRLIARYRKRAGAQTVAATSGGPGSNPATDTGSNEIYRLEAEGNVKIFTPTDLAEADKAVYDIDQAVLLLTGKDLKITTPQQVMTARDTMEYWSQKHMAVGRGLAVVTTSDGKRISADTLVGYTRNTDPVPGAGAGQGPKPAAAPPAPGKGDPTATSGKLERVEGFGNVEIRTPTETVKGDRGVYVADTGIARLAGSVRITRGQNFVTGNEALVNMRTGISTLVQERGRRVEGLVVPGDAQAGAAQPGAAQPGAPTQPKPRSTPSTPAPRR
jgi:lipopolysaccharide export system protein LptA